MQFTATITATRVEGKFVRAEEIAEAIADAIASVDLSGLGDDGGSEYELLDHTVEHVPASRARKVG